MAAPGGSGGEAGQLLQDGVAHAGGADAGRAVLHDVGGAVARIQGGADGALYEVGGVGEVERVAEQHGEAENEGERVGGALAGDVGRRAVDGLVEALAASA